MKIKTTIKLLFTFAVLAGVFSCNSDKFDSEFGGAVPYKPCSCGKMPLSGLQFSQGEVYLFKDSIPEQMNEQLRKEINSAPFPIVCSIIYNSETKDASISIANLLYPDGSTIPHVGSVCNFPDFAKKWLIPENGFKVIIEGKIYEPCNSSGYTDVVYIDYVLTSLKRK